MVTIQSGVSIVGLKECEVYNFNEAIMLMRYGEENRCYREKNMHEHSSRSHTIFQLVADPPFPSDSAGLLHGNMDTRQAVCRLCPSIPAALHLSWTDCWCFPSTFLRPQCSVPPLRNVDCFSLFGGCLCRLLIGFFFTKNTYIPVCQRNLDWC